MVTVILYAAQGTWHTTEICTALYNTEGWWTKPVLQRELLHVRKKEAEFHVPGHPRKVPNVRLSEGYNAEKRRVRASILLLQATTRGTREGEEVAHARFVFNFGLDFISTGGSFPPTRNAACVQTYPTCQSGSY